MMVHQILSQQELIDFHKLHFSSTCIDHFSAHFLWPVTEEIVDDDLLGYYTDGTKRTLTEEQIAIFRHSEMQRMKLDKQDLYETGENGQIETTSAGEHSMSQSALTNRKIASDLTLTPNNTGKPLTNKARKAQKAKLKGYFRQNVKPDLRKRTWDKVDTGLESLDYDEIDDNSELGRVPSAQRRKISYDDT